MEVVQRLYTVDEFEQFADAPENRDRLLELINGEIVEKAPTFKHGLAVVNLSTDLNIHVRRTGSGTIVSEVRHRVEGDNYNSRIPDVSYYAGNREMPERGSVPVPPDLAVEVQSPDDTIKAMREKARYLLANGTKIVWLVLLKQRVVEVYTLTDEQVSGEDDTLSGDDVLPGFTMAVRDIFYDPAQRK